jgi:hypothetical protein
MRPVNATGAKRGMIGPPQAAKTGGCAQTGPKRRRLQGNRAAGTDQPLHGGFRRIENCVPSAI